MKLKILLFTGFFLLLLLGRNFSYGMNHVFTSSKENMSLSFIEEFHRDINFTISMPQLDDELLQTALTPRDATQLNSHVIPQTFPGALLTYGVTSFFWPFILPLLTPLLFTLILYFYYKINRHFFSEETALTSSVLLLFFPTFTYLGTQLVSDDLLSLLFLLAGAYLFLLRKMPGSALLLGMAIFVRAANLIWALPFIVLALLKLKDKNYFSSLTRFLKSLILFLLPVFAALGLNYWLYGSPFKTGYHIQYPIIQSVLGTESGAFKAGFDELWFQIKQYVVLLYPLPLLLSVFAVYKLHGKSQFASLSADFGKFSSRPSSRTLLFITYITLGLFLLLGYQYAGTIFWGHDAAALNSSFMRYVLPFYLLFPALSAFALKELRLKYRVALTALLFLSFVLTSLFFRGGLNEKWSQEKLGLEIQELVLKGSTGQSLVFTRQFDKFVFPYRQTLTMPLLRSRLAYGYTNISPWIAPLDYSMIAQKMTYLFEHKKDFVLLADSETDLPRLQSELAKYNLLLRPKAQSSAAVLYAPALLR